MSGWEMIVGTVSASNAAVLKTAVANCTLGKKAVGGGYRIFGSVADITDYESYPSDNDTWTVKAAENNGNSNT